MYILYTDILVIHFDLKYDAFFKKRTEAADLCGALANCGEIRCFGMFLKKASYLSIFYINLFMFVYKPKLLLLLLLLLHDILVNGCCCLPIYISINLFIYLFIYLSTYLSIYISIYLSIYLSIYFCCSCSSQNQQ